MDIGIMKIIRRARKPENLRSDTGGQMDIPSFKSIMLLPYMTK